VAPDSSLMNCEMNLVMLKFLLMCEASKQLCVGASVARFTPEHTLTMPDSG